MCQQSTIYTMQKVSNPLRCHYKPFKYIIGLVISIAFLSISSNTLSIDYYVTTAELNIRSGAGTSFKSLGVIEKGDTVKLMEVTTSDWVIIKYRGIIGYSSNQYLRKIEIVETDVKSGPPEYISSRKFNAVLVGIGFLIIFIIVLHFAGQYYRNKSFTAILSLFFGTFGLQKFYLGQATQGAYSILFCWTTIPTLIGIFDFVKFSFAKDKYFNNKYNQNSRKMAHIERPISKMMKDSQTAGSEIDRSIIDVNSESFDLTIERSKTFGSNLSDVPSWNHMYVYSYSALLNASKLQKVFYLEFRKRFLNGEYVNIQGNTNYAFVLYFDLLNEYNSHQDIELIDKQFKLLGEICPKTKGYSLASLQELLRNRTDHYSIEKLQELQEPTYQFEYGYSNYDPDEYSLGSLYKNKLGLNKQETAWLNKFWNPSNVFTSIEGCCIITIKHYLLIMKELNKELRGEQTSVAKEVEYFKKIVFDIKGMADNHWGIYDQGYLKSNVESDIYNTIFRRVENSVRNDLGHKRKVGEFTRYEYSDKFEQHLGTRLNRIIEEKRVEIGKPDTETQIELNTHNVNRWKIEFSALKDTFQIERKDDFIEGVIKLEETNQKNPNTENIFFEASRFIAKYSRTQALKYYAQYIYYDLKSKKFDNKQLAKTIQKSLFKTNDQVEEFKRIIEELIHSANIQRALEDIAKIYIPKRRRVVLDKSEIKEVEEKYNGTVELLNEYLEEDQEEIWKEDDSVESKMEEIEISVSQNSQGVSLFNKGISMSKVQEQLVKAIATNSFLIHQVDVEKFALENGMLKNQLIDSINEKCADHLEGEMLIEEEEDNYTIEESYYKEITS